MTTNESSLPGGSASLPKPGPMQDLGRRADELGSRVQGGLRDKAHELEERGHHLQERALAAKDRLVHDVQDGRERVTREVQEHPMRSMLWAFAAGAVVGLLMARRRR